MKSIFIVILAVFLFVPMAQAFSVPEEIQVTSAPSVASDSPSFSISDVKKAISKGMKAVNKKLETLKKEFTKKDSETAKSVDALGQKVEEQNEALSKIGDGVKEGNRKIDSLDNKLTNEKTGAFKKLTDHVWSAGKELSDSIMIYLIVLGLVLAVLGLCGFLAFRKLGRRIEEKIDNVQTSVDDVHTAVDEVPGKVKLLDPCVITVHDVMGKKITFTPTIVNNMYASLYVPKTITVAQTDPTQIVRVPMSNPTRLHSTTREIMTDFYNGLYDGIDLHSTQQKKLIESLIGTEIVVE